jgi:dTDP-glucose 4,6-dehydratase
MRVLIAGAAGFIGSHLCDQLLEMGHFVVGVDNLTSGDIRNINHLSRHPRFHYYSGDVTKTFHSSGSFDAMYHLACPSSSVYGEPCAIEALESYSVGTRNLLELAKVHNSHFILVSKPEQSFRIPMQGNNGNGASGHPIGMMCDATHRVAVNFAETLTREYHNRFGVPIGIARVTHTYGPRMHFRDGHLISEFIWSSLSGLPLHVPGGGEHPEDCCYISDVVRGLALLLNHRYLGPVEFASFKDVSASELARIVNDAIDSNSQIVYDAAAEQRIIRRVIEITSAHDVLNWEPLIDLKEGIWKTVEHLRLNPHELKRILVRRQIAS